MLLADVFQGASVVDGRAHLRDVEAPTSVTTVAMGNAPVAELVQMALEVRPQACALVLEDGRVWILTGGESGMIAFAGDSINDDQRTAIEALEVALVELGAVGLADDAEPEVEAKPKRRRKPEPEPEPEVDEVDEVDKVEADVEWQAYEMPTS